MIPRTFPLRCIELSLKDGRKAFPVGAEFSDIPQDILEYNGIIMPKTCFSCSNIRYLLDKEIPYCDRFNTAPGIHTRIFITENYVCQFFNIPDSRKNNQKIWARQVYIRDNYTCQKCGQTGGNLHAHHIYCFSQYPNLAWVLDNGITLCEKCHKDIHRKEKDNGIYPIIGVKKPMNQGEL